MTTIAAPSAPSAPSAPAPRRRPRPARRNVQDGLILLTTLVVVVVIVFPFAWMVLTSLRPASEMFNLQRLVPSHFTLDGYQRLFSTSNFGRYVVNSLIVSSCAMVLSVLVSCLAGYAFSRYEFRGKRAMMSGVIGVHLFPFVILITPLYMFFAQLKLLNTYHGLVIAYVGLTLPFATYLMMGYFQIVPRVLDEAARVDGCGTLTVLFRVVLPVAWPGVVTVAINTFIVAWEEYLFAKTFMTDEDLKTVQVGLANFFGEYTAQWDLVMCASVVASIPTIVLFSIAQRRLVAGLAAGSVKE